MIEWAVTDVESNALKLPYAVDVPYSTWLSEFVSVLQVMVAPLPVNPDACTALMFGGTGAELFDGQPAMFVVRGE